MVVLFTVAGGVIDAVELLEVEEGVTEVLSTGVSGLLRGELAIVRGDSVAVSGEFVGVILVTEGGDC